MSILDQRILEARRAVIDDIFEPSKNYLSQENAFKLEQLKRDLSEESQENVSKVIQSVYLDCLEAKYGNLNIYQNDLLSLHTS